MSKTIAMSFSLSFFFFYYLLVFLQGLKKKKKNWNSKLKISDSTASLYNVEN